MAHDCPHATRAVLVSKHILRARVFLEQVGVLNEIYFNYIKDVRSGGIQFFFQPVLSQKSYFSAGSATKSHIFRQIN